MTIPNEPASELDREHKVLLELLQHSADQANHFRAKRDQIVGAAIALTAALVIFAAAERETVGVVLLIAGLFAFFAVAQMHNHGRYHENTCEAIRARLGQDYAAVSEIDREAREGISVGHAFDRGFVLSFVAAAAPFAAGLILLATR
jgi:hypothetical protein